MIATLYRPLSEEYPTFAKAKITDIIKIISYNYRKRFYGVGEFTMEIPINEPAVPLIEVDTVLIVSDTDCDYDDYLYITDITETATNFTIKGYDLKYLLAMRVTLFPETEQIKGAYGYYVVRGSTEYCIKEIVNYNITNSTDNNRKIYGFATAVNKGRGLSKDSYMTRLESLDEVVGAMCKNAKIGFDVIADKTSNKYVFDVITPTDRSDNQHDVSKVVFSEQFLNVTGLTRQLGVSSLKNAIYTVNSGNYDSYVQLVSREETASSGVLRKETAANVNCDVDEIQMYALKDAEDKLKTDTFEMEIQAAETYKKEWFIGDIVTFKKGGLQLNSSVVEVEVNKTGDSYRIKVVTGENTPTVIERLEDRIRKNSKLNDDPNTVKKTFRQSVSIGSNNQLDGNASTSVFVGSGNNVPEGNNVSNSAIIGLVNEGYSMSGSLVCGVNNGIYGGFSQSAVFGISNRISAGTSASLVFGSNNSINEYTSYSLISGADIKADTGFSRCLISGYNIEFTKKNNLNNTFYNCQIFGAAHKIEGTQTNNSEIKNCLIIGTGVDINPIKNSFRNWMFLIGGGTSSSPKTVFAVDSQGNVYANSFKTWSSVNSSSSTSSTSSTMAKAPLQSTNSDELSDLKSEIEQLKQRVSILEQQLNK